MIFLLALVQNFAALFGAAATVALTMLWQGAAIFLGLGLCLWLGPKTTAAQRFALWFAALLAMVSLPLLSSFMAGDVPAVPAAVAAGQASRPWLMMDLRWSFAIAALWLIASATRLVTLAVHALAVRRIWKQARPVAGLAESLELTSLSGRGCVEICTTTQLERPGVIGFFRPRILIPDWLLPKLTEAELRQVVLHEREHLRRFDDWSNLAQKLAQMAFPLNLGLSWAERQLCREREMACDEGVVRQTRAPRAYAACLASLAERGLDAKLLRRVEALSLGAWQKRSELAERVYSLLRGKQTLRPAGRRLLAVLVGCALLAATVALSRAPRLIGFAVPVEQAAVVPASSAAHSAMLPNVLPQSLHRVAPRTAAKRARVADEAAITEVVAASEPMSMRDDRSADVTTPVVAHAESRTVRQWVVLTVWQQTDANHATAVSDVEGAAEAHRSDAAARAMILKFLEVQARMHGVQALPREDWLIFEL